MNLFDEPITLESLLARIEALEAKVMDKPARQSTDVPPELREAWSLWYLHKASDKRWTAIAKQRQITKLAEVSGMNAELAVRIVGEAIERGWATFYALKEVPAPASPNRPMGAKAAFVSSESPLEKRLNWIRQQRHFDKIDDAECARLIGEATEKHRSAN